jgi:transcriptional regulator with XRE-family HTH domain
MRPTKELLGARIREIRKGLQLSQEQLSEKVDVDPRYISRIELGKCYPSLETLESIARSLNVELRELFEFSHLETGITSTLIVDKLLTGLTDETQRQLVFRITKAVTRAVISNI